MSINVGIFGVFSHFKSKKPGVVSIYSPVDSYIVSKKAVHHTRYTVHAVPVTQYIYYIII